MSGSRPDRLTVASAPQRARQAPRAQAVRRLQRGRTGLLAACDAVALFVAGVATFMLANVVAGPALVSPQWATALLAVGALVGWVAIFAAYGLYERQTSTIAASTFDEVATLLNALMAGSLILLLLGQGLARFVGIKVYSPSEAVLFLAFALVLVPAARWAVRSQLLPGVLNPRRTLIVGAGATGRLIEAKIAAHPDYGLEVVGFLDDDGATIGPDILGRAADLTEVVERHEIDWVVLAGTGSHYEQTLDLVRRVRRPDVHLSIVPTYFELFASNATIEDLQGIPVVSLPPMRLSRSVRLLKRSFDLSASLLGLAVLSPLLALIAVAIKLDSPGPVIFRQLRNGRGGDPFRIMKFRTMVDGAEDQRFDLAHLNQMDGPLFKIRSDPRITRTGDLLRRWRLDELPQLVNVVRGEMSLVGPRPFVVHEADQITGWAGRRLESLPGITGLWQVLGGNDLSFEEMVKLDYVYTTNWSLWWDIKILCQTIPVVLARRGAY
ncbi:sugar transferase [Baekduia soli]|uniref:Sugar transferase n=1 Tax=Baekduia soli TaxID=496014 RepID=A0A5B8UA71_9ACTN|nr:sugar transferase [Baekduia soli]QEC50099.1 sugar transferase [Baekduia soli]